MHDYRCDLCRTLAPLHTPVHQASPALDQRRGQPWPNATRPRLSPLACWLRSLETRRDWHRALSLLPPTPATLPYFVSPLTPQHSSKYCTIFGNKDTTTGSFTINIPKILPYCCTIFRPKGSSKMFDKLSLKCFIVSFLDLQKQIANQLWEWFHATCSSSDSKTLDNFLLQSWESCTMLWSYERLYL